MSYRRTERKFADEHSARKGARMRGIFRPGVIASIHDLPVTIQGWLKCSG